MRPDIEVVKSEARIGKEAVFIEGMVAPFDVQNSYGETLKRGAFNDQLKEKHPYMMFWDHHENRIFGVWTKVWGRKEGLYAKGLVFDPGMVKALKMMKVIGMPMHASLTFGEAGNKTLRRMAYHSRFHLLVYHLSKMFKGLFQRYDRADVTKAVLSDISLTNHPAFPETDVEIVSEGRLTKRRAKILQKVLDKATREKNFMSLMAPVLLRKDKK